jgi:hypothetical protein
MSETTAATTPPGYCFCGAKAHGICVVCHQELCFQASPLGKTGHGSYIDGSLNCPEHAQEASDKDKADRAEGARQVEAELAVSFQGAIITLQAKIDFAAKPVLIGDLEARYSRSGGMAQSSHFSHWNLRGDGERATLLGSLEHFQEDLSYNNRSSRKVDVYMSAAGRLFTTTKQPVRMGRFKMGGTVQEATYVSIPTTHGHFADALLAFLQELAGHTAP